MMDLSSLPVCIDGGIEQYYNKITRKVILLNGRKDLELVYASETLKSQCTNIKAARKLFHGDPQLSISLLARVNALQQAETLKDIIVQPAFHFHKLKNKGRKKQPLDENEKPYVPCNMDQIAGKVSIVEISEVSKHYE